MSCNDCMYRPTVSFISFGETSIRVAACPDHLAQFLEDYFLATAKTPAFDGYKATSRAVLLDALEKLVSALTAEPAPASRQIVDATVNALYLIERAKGKA